jgi:Spy/CpxP family protein refolding chaperone
MLTTQKPAPSLASSNAKPNQAAARPAASSAAANRATPTSAVPDPTCGVHRLEGALQLVESLKLSDDQVTKVSQLTREQTARCTEARIQHQANHAQILALLTPDQQQKLQTAAAADVSVHCHQDVHAAPGERAAHV